MFAIIWFTCDYHVILYYRFVKCMHVCGHGNNYGHVGTCTCTCCVGGILMGLKTFEPRWLCLLLTRDHNVGFPMG